MLAYLSSFVLCLSLSAAVLAEDSADVVIYGGTSGGITAAIQTARMGKTAILIEPTKFLGGLTTGGLGATDIGNKKLSTACPVNSTLRFFNITVSQVSGNSRLAMRTSRPNRTVIPVAKTPCGPSSLMRPPRSMMPC
jgi:hypothetical protein